MNSIHTLRLLSRIKTLSNPTAFGRFGYATSAKPDTGLKETVPATPKGTPTPTTTDTTPTTVKRMPSPLEPIQEPPMRTSTPTGQEKAYDAKITKLVDEISKLSLLEVGDLNELLKKRLNIPDAPMMGPMAFGVGPMQGVGGPAAEEEESAAPKKVQTSFTLKLIKFDESKKVALIKECKNLLEGMNLVQAKKFVESAPCVVKADVAKDEAEKLQKALEAVGASCEIS